jgi:hypothetical protein
VRERYTEKKDDERQERIEKSEKIVRDDDFAAPEEALDVYRRTDETTGTSTVLIKKVPVLTEKGLRMLPPGTVLIGPVDDAAEYTCMDAPPDCYPTKHRLTTG